jgi:DNA invertase Pin-like site-specific DNA recombinase
MGHARPDTTKAYTLDLEELDVVLARARGAEGSRALKYIGYIRVSRDREGGISPDQQRKEIEHWATTPGTEREVIWLPPDTDYSGKSLDRPSLRRALELLRLGEADGLVVSKLDRLTCSVADLNGLIKEAQTKGWNIVGLDIGVDLLTTNGKMVAQLIGAISEWYLDRVTEEWEKVRRYKIEDEGAHWGAPPLGYLRGRTTNGRGHDVPGALIVDEVWAPVVQEVFLRRANRGPDGSWSRLAQYLSAAGAPNYKFRSRPNSLREPKWSVAGVKSMIANRAYLGEARAGQFIKESAHPRLVDETLWVVANRKGPCFGKPEDRRGGPLLGQGLLRCGTCGSGLVRSGSRNRYQHRYEYYRCVSPTCACRVTISARRIEHYLVNIVLTRFPEASDLFDLTGGPNSRAGEAAARAVPIPRNTVAARAFLRSVLHSATVHACERIGHASHPAIRVTVEERVQFAWNE